jgi:hypothetical protein
LTYGRLTGRHRLQRPQLQTDGFGRAKAAVSSLKACATAALRS